MTTVLGSGFIMSNVQDEQLVAEVRNSTYCSIQQRLIEGSAGGTFAIEVSADNMFWKTAAFVNLATGSGSGVTAFSSSPDTSRSIPVFDVRYIRVRVSATGGSGRYEFIILGRDTGLARQESDSLPRE